MKEFERRPAPLPDARSPDGEVPGGGYKPGVAETLSRPSLLQASVISL